MLTAPACSCYVILIIHLRKLEEADYLRQPDKIIRRQHRACAPAMLTGTRLPRPWASTSRKAG